MIRNIAISMIAFPLNIAIRVYAYKNKIPLR